MEPNSKQRELIESLNGIYLVDAGAGTGKTFTLTRRYANILDSTGAEPDEILLITFTNNAAQEMKERVINHCEYNALDLQEAPISTFHSLCHKILLRDGFEAPPLLGLDERITSSTRLLENEVTERNEFENFLRGFMDRHTEHDPFFHVVRDHGNLLSLIKSLAAKGIFPTKNGWYQHGESYLDGRFDLFKSYFDRANETRPGTRGPKQSDLLDQIKSAFRTKIYTPDAPERINIPGGKADKQLHPKFAQRAFMENRDDLKKFVHDLYWGYVQFCLRRNYLNFSSLMMFAYVLLCERDDIRERHQHRYVMVDEFQDTSEIQFKLTLLLSASNNICVVGDWKQSIYSFQYASVKNIQEFQSRLTQYRDELNSDTECIPYPVSTVNEINLNVNYRSTQSILDFSRRSLEQKATQKERLDIDTIRENIVQLEAAKDDTNTNITGIISNDEHAAVLETIQDIIDNDEYSLPGPDGERTPSYDDIAVLNRTRNFGLELQNKAEQYNIPVAYEGGVELFKTNPAIILLAWLRVLDDPLSIKGWSVILERADYTLPEIRSMFPESELTDELHRHHAESESETEENVSSILESEFDIPHEMLQFLDKLRSFRNVITIARTVFDRYNIRGGFADKIVDVLNSAFEDQYANRGDLVRFIEDNIESGSTYEVDNALEADTVTVQTIHAAKGLEYPIVILADMNQYRFPGSSSGAPAIDYVDPAGLRQRKLFVDDEIPYNYDNWRTDIVSKCLSGEYDEERRLLYVALTRAEQYLFISADSERPGNFFEGLSAEIPVNEISNPEPEQVKAEPTEYTELEIADPDRRSPGTLSVHDIMDESVYEEAEATRGKDLGQSVHEFAERYLHNQEPEVASPGVDDKRNLTELLDGLTGRKRIEVPCSLPLTVTDRRITINGVIDLVHETKSKIEVIDYKTDLEPIAENEYRKQLSVYYHAVMGHYDDQRPVSINLFYTHNNKIKTLKPLPLNKLTNLATKHSFP